MKRVLVSGAGKGLGLCITKRYLAEGAEVHVIIRSITDEIRELQGKFRNYHVHLGDVSKKLLLAEALREITCEVAHFDYVYNVAGIFWEKDRKGLSELDIDEIEKMFQVNSLGSLRVLQGLDKQIDSSTKIVNISSESGSLTNCQDKGQYAYDMSKAALNMGLRIYNNEKGNPGNLIMVCPGWMRTDMGGQQADLDPDYSAERIIALAENMEQLKQGHLFFKYDGTPLPW